MKQKLTIVAITVIAILMPECVKAFDWGNLKGALNKDNVENLLNSVIGSSNIEVSDLAGEWGYKNPCIQFESKEILQKTGGVAMATTIEKKLAPYYKRAKMDNINLTISPDGQFSMAFHKGRFNGTLTKDENGIFLFNFNALGKLKPFVMKAYIKKGTTLEITFNVSKLLDLMNKIAQISKIETAKNAVSLLNSYDGLYAGFEMDKK